MLNRYSLCLAASLTCLAPATSYAESAEHASSSTQSEGYYRSLDRFNYLAAVDTSVTQPVTEVSKVGESTLLESRGITSNKWHQYLGFGSLALAASSVLMPKEEGGAHEYLAQGAALLGGAAVASGIWVHADDIDLSKGFSDPDNMHALFTTLGALGYLIAVSQAPDGGHAGAGGLGFAAMTLGIKYAW